MRQYYFSSHGQEYLIRLKISTGKYGIFNNGLELQDAGFTSFQVTQKNAGLYCQSLVSEFIRNLSKREKR